MTTNKCKYCGVANCDDDACFWKAHKERSDIKKANNEKSSISMLKDMGFEVTVLNAETRHYRVGRFDFWPSTGKFYCQRTGEKGRGVRNLIGKIKK